MKTYIEPNINLWEEIIQRPKIEHQILFTKVQNILDEVKLKGDDALKQMSLQFDKVNLVNFNITQEDIKKANKLVSPILKKAIQQAYKNIFKFHQAQIQNPRVITTMSGVQCWQKSVPIEKIGLYIPGGTAPLFSTVLMLGVPAMIAGCSSIVLCSPPDKNGNLHPAIIYTANLIGIKNIFKIGGAQAIAAMAYGTETIPKVYKIFGPGNQYVTAAKQIVQLNGLGIDLPAGPTELCIYGDETSHPKFMAADILAQAEHGTDSQIILITKNKKIGLAVQEYIRAQITSLPRQEIAQIALENSKCIVIKNLKKVSQFINQYAPEHLILACKDCRQLANQITNAGSIFLGNYTPEAVGDYASGTNHTLPTSGYAKIYSGVNLNSFMKTITLQQLTKQGLKNLSSTVTTMSEAEELQGHSNSVKIRFN